MTSEERPSNMVISTLIKNKTKRENKAASQKTQHVLTDHFLIIIHHEKYIIEYILYFKCLFIE